MGVKRLGHWLAVLAIALQAAWPLIAAATLRSVELVPVCTVEGVTHYVEIPTGKSPVDGVHGQHCVFCTLGVGVALASQPDAFWFPDATTIPILSGIEISHPRPVLLVHGARAPPLSSVVIADHHNFGGQDETGLFAGRVARAPYG